MVLRSCYLFQELSEPQLQRLTSVTRETRTQKGQWLYREGEEAEELYLLQQGAVELNTRVNEDFDLPITILRKSGGCFGIAALIDPHVYNLSARCVEDSVLLLMKQTDLQGLFLNDHEMGYRVMANLATHLLDRLNETRKELKIHFSSIFKSIHS